MRVLIAEDEPISRRLLHAALTQMGYDVTATADGREAWEVLQREDIGLVVADWMMADVDGLELVRRIRDREADHYVYVILLTSRAEKQDIVRGLEAGADDYITKPFDRAELAVRVNCGRRIIDLERQLADKNRQLAGMAMMDGLTGILNRRAFDDALERSHRHSRRYGHQYSLGMIDIDHFKAYNDRFGHAAGDTVLRTVAQTLRGSLRPSDLVFRYGGEEFVCLFPETDREGALAAATRLLQAVTDVAIAHPGNQSFGIVTVSIGIATQAPANGGGPLDLLQAADVALFEAKHSGRNRVAVYRAVADGRPAGPEPTAAPTHHGI
ncbi:MAG: diguanylate cyclase [Acidobacteriota bacterium]